MCDSWMNLKKINGLTLLLMDEKAFQRSDYVYSVCFRTLDYQNLFAKRIETKIL